MRFLRFKLNFSSIRQMKNVYFSINLSKDFDFDKNVDDFKWY